MIYTYLTDDDLKTAVNKMDLNFFMTITLSSIVNSTTFNEDKVIALR